MLAASNFTINSTHVLLIFLAFILSTIIATIIRKILYRIKYAKRYFIFPKISVKGIANVAMVIAIAIAAILLLTIVTAGFFGVIFRAYPGWRVTIEAILIKIGGLLFGPIIGMFIGAVTDLLSVALTAGMFHYGYFMAAIIFGLLSGLISVILNITKKNSFHFTTLSTLAVLAVYASIIIYIMFHADGSLEFPLFGKNFKINKFILLGIVSAVFGSGIFGLWLGLILSNRVSFALNMAEIKYWWKYKSRINIFKLKLKKENRTNDAAIEQFNWFAKHNKQQFTAKNEINNLIAKKDKIKKTNWFIYFMPVLVTVLTVEPIVSIYMLPVFDLNFSQFTYDQALMFRMGMWFIMSFMNVAIIFPVYRIVCPSMHYNYHDDLVESIGIKLMND